MRGPCGLQLRRLWRLRRLQRLRRPRRLRKLRRLLPWRVRPCAVAPPRQRVARLRPPRAALPAPRPMQHRCRTHHRPPLPPLPPWPSPLPPPPSPSPPPRRWRLLQSGVHHRCSLARRRLARSAAKNYSPWEAKGLGRSKASPAEPVGRECLVGPRRRRRRRRRWRCRPCCAVRSGGAERARWPSTPRHTTRTWRSSSRPCHWRLSGGVPCQSADVMQCSGRPSSSRSSSTPPGSSWGC